MTSETLYGKRTKAPSDEATREFGVVKQNNAPARTVRNEAAVRAINTGSRRVTRAPDMSKPTSLSRAPSVSIGVPRTGVVRRSGSSLQIKPKMRTVRSTELKPFPTALVILAMLCTALIMYVIFNTVQINEFTLNISKMQAELEILNNKKKELELTLEQKNDLREIEKYATESLGMVKKDRVLKKYVSINSEDKIEVTDVLAETAKVGISTIMSAVGKNFESFMEYIN